MTSGNIAGRPALPYNIVRPATHREWLASRCKGIGSSEVGVLVGVSRFSTPVQLWRNKVDTLAGNPPQEKESAVMRAGHEFEPAVALLWQLRSGDEMDPDSVGDWIAEDREREYLRVSPDRIFYDKNTGEAYIVECKTTKLDIDEKSYPKSWYYQAQYQMGVMHIKRAVIAWISYYGTLSFAAVEVKFDPDLYEAIVMMIENFWCGHVLTGIPPRVVLADDDVKELFPKGKEEKTIVAEGSVAALVREYNEKLPEYNSLDQRLDEIKLRLKDTMEDATVLKDENGKILATFKNAKVREELDVEALRRENPELYRSCCVKVEVFDRDSFEEEYAEEFRRYQKAVTGARRLVVKKLDS